MSQCKAFGEISCTCLMLLIAGRQQNTVIQSGFWVQIPSLPCNGVTPSKCLRFLLGQVGITVRMSRSWGYGED